MFEPTKRMAIRCKKCGTLPSFERYDRQPSYYHDEETGEDVDLLPVIGVFIGCDGGCLRHCVEMTKYPDMRLDTIYDGLQKMANLLCDWWNKKQ